uniref:leucine-rich repeat and guanylate kinase domain-containing protein isoform X2 n=1 Tax=Pristiophorus japonicus TaxID=55135 RepID=UPI00398F830C
MESTAIGESEVPADEEWEEMVGTAREEMVRECAQEESVQELAAEMLEGVLNQQAREVVEEFYQELLDNILSSSEASSSEECKSPSEESVEEQFNGVLTEEILVKGLSNLRHSATGLEQAYLHLSLPDYQLSDITILYNYTHLQKLELPNNNIADLRCVSCMPYLLQLDASHNALSSFDDLTLPKYIKEVDISYNQIFKMKDLSDYQFLFKLNLDNNQIQAIEGLQNCRCLSYLSLAENRLLEVSGLDNLPIKFLCLISDLNEIKHMQNLLHLRVLNLLQNPIQENPDYLFWVLFMVQKLTNLDHKRVKATDKVMAINTYNPPAEVVAASDHMTHIMYSFLQFQRIYDSTLPNIDIPYPMLVLTGPQASGKRELAHMLSQEFKDYFGYCVCHTSRRPYFGEEDGCDYHFVSEQRFEEMIQLGKFIETVKYNGHYFGLSRDALEAVASAGLACCIHMELEGVHSLKKTYLDPRYILLIPMNKEVHVKRLQLRGLYNESQIDFATSRVESYITMNQKYPGYFDAVINTDDLLDAYRQLSQLLREYLNLTDRGTNDSIRSREVDKRQMPDMSKNLSSDVSQINWNKILWSSGLAPEFMDSSTRNYSSRIQATLSAERTPLEQFSIDQRQKVAREAVMGRTPHAYASLFKRVQNLPALGVQSTDVSKMMSDTSLIPVASNISCNRSFHSFSLPTSSEATHHTFEASSLSSDSFSEKTKNVDQDTDSSVELAFQALQFVTNLGELDSLHTPEEARTEPTKELPPASVLLSSQSLQFPTPRLGLNIKPILPPIPSGRTAAELPDSPKQAVCTLK